ncbi:MAG: hypothetical protein ABIJ92_01510 [Candidatus Aenigmatarchaeota archaeon]
MKSIFVAGSRKFYEDVEKIVELCKQNGIKVETAGKSQSTEDTLESESSALFRAFERIENADILYVSSKNGYIGKTVAMEISYAFSKNKEIISSEKIEDFSVQALVSKIMETEELVKYATSD